MKRVLIGALILILLGFGILKLMFSGVEPESNINLPWQVSTTEEGNTQVLGVDIGDATFKELMHELKLLAEPALFEGPDGSLSLEAYFGKKKFGILEARLIAEMDAEQPLLEKMRNEHEKRKATPSNSWKYSLNVENTRLANELRVWRLIYLPVTDYEAKQIAFFGEPKEKIKINDTAQYWLYPERGIALLWDTEGSEIFYYTAAKDFSRLKASLPMKIQVQRF